jgi:hypothetical protein
MVDLAVRGATAGLHVAQAFLVSQSGKRHRQKLIAFRQSFQILVASITDDVFLKLLARQKLPQLCKDDPSEVHASLCRIPEGRLYRTAVELEV